MLEGLLPHHSNEKQLRHQQSMEHIKSPTSFNLKKDADLQRYQMLISQLKDSKDPNVLRTIEIFEKSQGLSVESTLHLTQEVNRLRKRVIELEQKTVDSGIASPAEWESARIRDLELALQRERRLRMAESS
jgi:G3E family GTPase